jgi:hypothetical protein
MNHKETGKIQGVLLMLEKTLTKHGKDIYVILMRTIRTDNEKIIFA